MIRSRHKDEGRFPKPKVGGSSLSGPPIKSTAYYQLLTIEFRSGSLTRNVNGKTMGRWPPPDVAEPAGPVSRHGRYSGSAAPFAH